MTQAKSYDKEKDKFEDIIDFTWGDNGIATSEKYDLDDKNAKKNVQKYTYTYSN